MNLTTQLRLILLVCGVVLLLAMYWFGRRKNVEPGYKAQRFDPARVDEQLDDDMDYSSLSDEAQDAILVDEIAADEVPPAIHVRTGGTRRHDDIVFAESAYLDEDEDKLPVLQPQAVAGRSEPVWRDEIVEDPAPHSERDWQVSAIDEEPVVSHVTESEIYHLDVEPVTTQIDDDMGVIPALESPVQYAAAPMTPESAPTQAAPLLSEAVASPTLTIKPEPEPELAPRPAVRPTVSATASVPRKIMALRLAFNTEGVSGDKLLALLQTERLQLGKFNIFHRMQQQASVFSVASMVEPGTFDLNTMPAQRYPGVTLFTMLPGVLDAPMMFDQMLSCAQHLAQATGGVLQDERGSKLNPYLVDRLRDEVLDFQHLLGGVVSTGSATTV